jgi:hypothetical protein
MKINVLVLTLFTALIFSSCKKAACDCEPENTLEGKWQMERVYGGLMGIDLNYAPNEVTWDFNGSQNTVDVTNNILTSGPKSIYARFNTGVYAYHTQNINGANYLFIDSTEIGIYTINSSKLMIDDGLAADGFVTEFVR